MDDGIECQSVFPGIGKIRDADTWIFGCRPLNPTQQSFTCSYAFTWSTTMSDICIIKLKELKCFTTGLTVLQWKIATSTIVWSVSLPRPDPDKTEKLSGCRNVFQFPHSPLFLHVPLCSPCEARSGHATFTFARPYETYKRGPVR
jgi:hypothetical protein